MNNKLLTFDITNNKDRRILIKFIQNAGLFRIEKSVFLGETTKYKMKELLEKIKKYLYRDKIIIHIFDINNKSMDNMININLKKDEKKIEEEKQYLKKRKKYKKK